MHRSQTARRLQAVAFAALAVHAFAGPATWAAGDNSRLTLVPFGFGEGGTEKAANKFGQLLADELKTREDDLRWVPLPRAGGPSPSASAPSKKTPSKDALDALAEGGRLMDELKFDEAVAALKKGIDLEEADPATAEFKDIDYALVRLATAFFRMGEEKKAQQALYQVARLSPDYRLPDGPFPPVFRREFEKAQRRVEKASKGTVSVEGPAGSTVYLNGRDLGMVPVQQDDLSAGVHFVRVDGAHGERFGQVVELKGGVAKVRATFGGSSAGPAVAVDLRIGATLDADTAARTARLCKAADVEYVVVGYLYRSAERRLTIAPALYSARRQGFTRLPRYDFDDDALTANVEAFRLADDITARLKSFDAPEVLPLSLGLDGAKAVALAKADSTKKGGSEGRAKPVEVKPSDKPKVVQEGDLVPKDGQDGTKVRTLEHRSELVDKGTGSTQGEVEGSHKAVTGGIPWWVWAVAGAAVAGAATGGIYAVTQANRPVTGTANASWQ